MWIDVNLKKFYTIFKLTTIGEIKDEQIDEGLKQSGVTDLPKKDKLKAIKYLYFGLL
jgi:hypothetical protein